jgi:hypothetical protein
MAAPNIVNVTSIVGKTNAMSVTTGTDPIVLNPASSGKVFRINSLIISNIDGANTADITADVYKGQTTSYKLASTVTVPADASLVIITRDNLIYLEENDSIRLTASANGDLQAVCSFEEIS